MTSFGAATDNYVIWSDDLAAIVLRAESLGFSRDRVTTALRVSPRDLLAVEQRPGRLTSSRADDSRTHVAAH